MNRSKIYMTLVGDVKQRYDNKILDIGGIDPYTLAQKDLSVDPKDFPDITVLDIGNYLVQSVSPYTKRSFNAYKSTEAYSFFESGFVLSVGAKKINELVILIGRVKHSQRMNANASKSWILANMNGNIKSAHCDCVGGLSETCSHVAAICFAVSNIGESHEIKSVTEMLSKWNIPSFKDVSMSLAKDMHWKYPSSSEEHKKHETNVTKWCKSVKPFSNDEMDEFIKKCYSFGDIINFGSMVMTSEGRRKTNIKDTIFLASLYNVEYKNKNLHQLVEIGKTVSLDVTHDEVKEISKITLNKEQSKFYLGLRRGRVTGSNFKNCCVTNIANPALTTINYMINPKSLDNVPSIKYQTKNRKKAIEEYTRKARCDHNSFEYNRCGLIINPRLPYFVGSPDGIVSCSCHGKGCVEVKCLKILQSGGSFQVLTAKPNNILNKQGNRYVIERSHALFYQVQLQINLVSLKYCHLVFWSPKEFLVVTVESDFEFWKTAMEKASTFHEQVVMPELLGKYYTKCDESDTSDENKELDLVSLEIEVLCSDVKQELIGLEIDILCSDEEQKIEEIKASYDGDDEYYDGEDICNPQHKSKREEKIVRESRSKNNISDFPYVTSFTEIGVTNARNLMKLSINDILLTFFDHEDKLRLLYNEHITHLKRNYRPKDLPEMISLDIIDEKQFQAMANFAEAKLADLEKEHNSTDVIFDVIIPEWVLAVFCDAFNLTRTEAIAVSKKNRSLIELSESQI